MLYTLIKGENSRFREPVYHKYIDSTTYKNVEPITKIPLLCVGSTKKHEGVFVF